MLLFGRFSPDIAPAIAASGLENMNGTPTAVFGGLAPPGIFSQTRQGVATITIGDSFALRESMVAHFGAGSPVGSYIAFGGHAAPGADAPRLAMSLPTGTLNGDILLSLLVEQPPVNELVLYRKPDASLQLQQGDKVWTLIPAPVTDDALAAYDLVGSLDGVVSPDVLMLDPTDRISDVW